MVSVTHICDEGRQPSQHMTYSLIISMNEAVMFKQKINDFSHHASDKHHTAY
jgi:hypothetical protein